MAGLLLLVATLGLIVGAVGLITPVEWLGVTDRKRAGLVIVASFLIGVIGAALADPDTASAHEPQPLVALPETTVPSTTTTTAPTTTAAPTASTMVTTTVAAGPADSAAVVVSITDGDTIRVRLPDGSDERVRLIGIDAPEPGAPGAPGAANLLRELLADGEVMLTVDVSDRDRFDRLLRYVWVGDRLINEELVAAGVAIAKRYPPDTAYAEVFETAEGQAQVLAFGLWASTTTSTTSSTATSTTVLAFVSPTTTAEATGCQPSYTGACVPVGVSDVDCAGGSGDGPYYVGPVTVVGPDEYGLDRDNDGIGCEGS